MAEQRPLAGENVLTHRVISEVFTKHHINPGKTTQCDNIEDHKLGITSVAITYSSKILLRTVSWLVRQWLGYSSGFAA